MESRVARYHSDESNDSIGRRSRNNEKLYKSIYEMSEYSNIEGVATIPTTNEVDITKIKELLKSREEYQKEKKYAMLSREEVKSTPVEEEIVDDRNYDIRDILNKAKDERTEADNRYHSLKNTQYDILKNIKVNDQIKKEDYLDTDNVDESLKKLINTITNTSMLNKMGDDELSLDMFSDLKSSGQTEVTDVEAIMNSLEKSDIKEKTIETTKDLDKSFYTSSMNFSSKDFEDLSDIKKSVKKNNTLSKILLGLLALILVGIIVYIVIMLVK